MPNGHYAGGGGNYQSNQPQRQNSGGIRGQHNHGIPNNPPQNATSIFGFEPVQKILQPKSGKEANDFINDVRSYVKEVSEHLSSSQLRNLYGYLKKETDHAKLYLLRPKVAYAAGRNETPAFKQFAELVDKLISAVDSQEKMNEFVNFFEAIIAYHKYFEKKRGAKQ